MQLNPARGRKQIDINILGDPSIQLVYAAQPREGTETGKNTFFNDFDIDYKVYAAQPREGTET